MRANEYMLMQIPVHMRRPDVTEERHLRACLLVLLQAARLGVRMVRLFRLMDVNMRLPVMPDAAAAEESMHGVRLNAIDPWLFV